MHRTCSLVLAVTLIAGAAPGRAQQQPIDSAYTARIRELTPTDPKWKFTTELVDYLPASSTVPSPLKILGYVPGTVGRLSHVAEVNRYMRAVDAASSRVQVFSMGMSDENREMLIVAIADDSVMAKLDEHRTMLGRLADPRGLAPAERAKLISSAKPIYWLTGAIHSPETGSPEMLMELVYRLAVDESEHIKAIRRNVITLITPVLEVDGRDRIVDSYQLAMRLKVGPYGVGLPYWGKYTAHDNNRDGMVLSQKLTQHYMKHFLHWKPTVAHDLHESVPFLYTSTGTGPYNDEFDPIVIDEWHTLAYQEITELTRRGLPGVWTHGFYDGWAPNYVLAISNLHNSIGRFYETYTSQGAECHTVKLPASATERRWDRPNVPVNNVKWCIRSNVNFSQSGVLVALRYVADHKETFLANAVAKAERMIERGRSAAPYAFVIPRDQRRAAEAADLVNLFKAHGSEIHVASADFEVKTEAGRAAEPARPRAGGDSAVTAAAIPAAGHPPRDSAVKADTSKATTATPATTTTPGARARTYTVRKGDWIVRLDQPYSATPRTLLAIQKYKADDPAPYDDTGWTLDMLRHVVTTKIADSSILTAPMQPLVGDARVEGTTSGSGAVLLVRHAGDWRSAVLPWKAAPNRVHIADAAFTAGGVSYPAGTYVIRGADAKVRDVVKQLGMQATSASDVSVALRAVTLPRIALMHSWLETQNEGWVRYALDVFGVPYTYIADQSLRRPGALDRFDVVVFPHVSNYAQLLNGRPMVGPPLPWKKTATTPHHGVWDETDDMRPGMGLEGAAQLRRFVERGGLLLVEGNTSRLVTDLGFNTTVTFAEPKSLRARGGVYRAQAVAKTSPILYGYDQATFPLYFNQQPLLNVTARDTANIPQNVDTTILNQFERTRARVIVRYHEKQDSLLVSGLLVAGEELAGKAAVIDAPIGSGHVLLFTTRPFWRWQTQGAFALALNAIANWNALDPARPPSGASTSRPVAAGGP